LIFRNLTPSSAFILFSFGLFLSCESKQINSENQEKEVILVASREASSGGIILRLFNDNTFELGTLRKAKTEGIYKLTGDTLFLSATDNSKLNKKFSPNVFIVKDNRLVEVNNTGISFLEIQVNKVQ